MAKKILDENGYKIPIITTLHGTDITLVGNHPFYKPAVTFSINKSDIVTCVSNSLRDDTREFFGIKRDIEVIPNFIDMNKYIIQQDLCLIENPIPSKELIISHVSNFRPAQTQDPEPGGVVGFNFCSYTDSFGPGELIAANGIYNQWLDAAVEAAGTETPYFYTIHEPNFETPIPGSVSYTHLTLPTKA